MGRTRELSVKARIAVIRKEEVVPSMEKSSWILLLSSGDKSLIKWTLRTEPEKKLENDFRRSISCVT